VALVSDCDVCEPEKFYRDIDISQFDIQATEKKKAHALEPIIYADALEARALRSVQ